MGHRLNGLLSQSADKNEFLRLYFITKNYFQLPSLWEGLAMGFNFYFPIKAQI